MRKGQVVLLSTALVLVSSEAFAGATQECLDKIYTAAQGKSAAQIYAASSQYFDYGYVAHIAASRNKVKWDKAVEKEYTKNARELAQRTVIPEIAKGLTSHPQFLREYAKNGLRYVVTNIGDNKVTFATNPARCVVYDATMSGVSISTLLADMMKQ